MRPGRQVWKEIFQAIDEPLRQCFERGTPILRRSDQYFFERIHDEEAGLYSAPEEVWVDWSYECWQSNGQPIGVIHKLFEGQDRVVGARRMAAIAVLGGKLASQGNMFDMCRSACDTFAQLPHDIPYCLAYTTQPDEAPDASDPDNYTFVSSSTSSSDHTYIEDTHMLSRTFVLQETVGCPFDSKIAPSRIFVDPSESSVAETPGLTGPGDNHFWRPYLEEACRTKEPVNVVGFQHLLSDIEPRGFFTPVRAIVLPLSSPTDIVGAFIFLLSPTLPFKRTDSLSRFLAVISSQLQFGLQAVLNFESEVQRREELAALDKAKTSFFTSGAFD